MTIIKNAKKDSEKKHVKDIKTFLKKKKKNGVIRIFLRNKSKRYLNIEEIII